MSQVWLIAGCFRGFGRAIAEAVLAAGHQLVATARNPTHRVITGGSRHNLPQEAPQAFGEAVVEADGY